MTKGGGSHSQALTSKAWFALAAVERSGSKRACRPKLFSHGSVDFDRPLAPPTTTHDPPYQSPPTTCHVLLGDQQDPFPPPSSGQGPQRTVHAPLDECGPSAGRAQVGQVVSFIVLLFFQELGEALRFDPPEGWREGVCHLSL